MIESDQRVETLNEAREVIPFRGKLLSMKCIFSYKYKINSKVQYVKANIIGDVLRVVT
jgi:hypothetical protein